MEAIGRYILSITSAAILYSVLQSLLDKKSCSAILLRVVGGLFLSLTVIMPISDFELDTLLDTHWDYTSQADSFASQGRQQAQYQLAEIIKERSEAYILDKAMSYETPVHVEVTLHQGERPAPCAVRLQGSVSPYVKNAIQAWLSEEMGIPRENQTWVE